MSQKTLVLRGKIPSWQRFTVAIQGFFTHTDAKSLAREHSGEYIELMSLTEIKNAIQTLSEKERCELSAWLHPWPPDDWDRQMEEDVRGGKLDALAKEAEEAFRRGECRPFP